MIVYLTRSARFIAAKLSSFTYVCVFNVILAGEVEWVGLAALCMICKAVGPAVRAIFLLG